MFTSFSKLILNLIALSYLVQSMEVPSVIPNDIKGLCKDTNFLSIWESYLRQSDSKDDRGI